MQIFITLKMYLQVFIKVCTLLDRKVSYINNLFIIFFNLCFQEDNEAHPSGEESDEVKANSALKLANKLSANVSKTRVSEFLFIHLFIYIIFLKLIVAHDTVIAIQLGNISM